MARKDVPEDLVLFEGEKVIAVEIMGRPPGILMHNALSMLNIEQSSKKGFCVHNIPLKKPCETCLESCTYRTDEGDLAIPAVAVQGCMRNAARAYRRGGKAVAPLISGTLRIHPPMATVGQTKYEIHVIPAVVQRRRVIRFRPWIRKWKASFHISYDPSFGLDAKLSQEVLRDGGRRIGILDFRPEHSGPFGLFDVTKFEELGA